MPISTVWILKYVQQCYVKWFWTISSLGAPVSLHDKRLFLIFQTTRRLSEFKSYLWCFKNARLTSLYESIVLSKAYLKAFDSGKSQNVLCPHDQSSLNNPANNKIKTIFSSHVLFFAWECFKSDKLYALY